jgi:hypothetical protein
MTSLPELSKFTDVIQHPQEAKLRPCPFCGKEMSEKNFFSCDGYPQACGCWEMTHAGEEAEKVWNTRPIEDALAARVAELEGALRDIRDHYWVNEDVGDVIRKVLK